MPAAAKHLFSRTSHPMASSNSSNNNHVVHFVLFPLMAQGHAIPMLDIAKLLSQAAPSLSVTILTTPHNATRLRNSLLSHPRIHLTLLQPFHAYQNLDQLPSFNHFLSFLSSMAHDLQPQALALCKTLSPKPTCIISDICLPWTLDIASQIGVPWVSFNGGSCFGNVAMSKILGSGICERVESDGEYFEVPGLEHRIEVSKAQLPIGFMSGGMMKFVEQIGEAERKAYGMIVNSFEELEGSYVRELKKMRGDRVWCVGPVSLCNKHYEDKAQRGKESTEEEDNSNDQVMKWLDSQDPNSVLYVCLGSLHNLKTPQLIELGLGLESSEKPFIWVVRASSKLEKWIEEEGFEERIKRRGLVIRDWAPQLLILSHPAIGGFLTHCGWNSILEGISAGLPMLTWPLFSEQFLNEKFVADVLNIAVKVGAQYPVMKMKDGGEEEEEEEGMIEVKKEDVREAIERVMGKGNEAEERTKKARELGVMANNALEDGCSSQLNIALFIDDIVKANKISS